jgi:hypothetical protein
MKINNFKKQIEKINNQNIVDVYLTYTTMKKLLDIELKNLKEYIIKNKHKDFNIKHVKKSWVEGYYKKAHKRISIKK